MSKVFLATTEIDPATKKGKLSMGSEYNRARFADFLTANPGIRLRIEAITPESSKQRRMFEGAYIPLIAYYQENIDWQDSDDLRKVRDWIMLEFNSTWLTMGKDKKALKVAKSSKGELNRGLMDRILDWMNDQAYQTELLNPADYKDWSDRIRPYDTEPTYIGYLLKCKKLRPKI